MVKGEPGQVYAFCNICKENVPLDVTESDVEANTSGITTVLSMHGSPQHAILVYLDKNLKVRGVEYPSMLQVKDAPAVDTESELPKEDSVHDLGSVISSFGDKQAISIKSFATICAQIILGNSLYLIHANKSIAQVVKEQLETLFPEQKTSLFVINYDDIDSVTGMRPTIYDLQYHSFVSEGLAIETEYFENLIKDAVSDANGFSLLKNEFSKLKYSYRRLWELLSSGARSYTHKRLAYLVSIDLSLIPLLLKMAENDGVDVDSRVKAGLK
ncbi:MAG: hypothetical protein RTU92_14075 [Candidatus Thorarchaeota archaeon]